LEGKQRRELDTMLAQMERNERRKLYKQAAGIKKQNISSGRSNGRPESLDDIVLTLLKGENESERAEEKCTGTVTWAGLKTCCVGETECQLNGHRIAVGDVVATSAEPLTRFASSPTSPTGGEVIPRVVRVLPRKTLLSRPDPSNPHLELPIVANVDLVIVVVSVKSPPLHPRLIDRYLIAIERGGAQAVLCVNKIDLLSVDERKCEFLKLEPYADIDVPLIGCSVETGEGVEEVRELLRGKLCAFVGHSGVGKSSLLNALSPGLAQLTGNVSEGYGRGRHTTTWSSLHDLGDGTRVIDTPGIRSLGLKELSVEELKWHFPEFENLKCKFSDCSHIHEPACGVQDAVQRRDISQARYETYRRLLLG
jgi:ribosome biogenesis GTPase